MSARRCTSTALASLCALAGCLVLWTGSAHARVTHEYIPALSQSLSESIPAEGPHGEAIALPGPRLEETATVADAGHLWIAEPGRIDEYDAATGQFLGQIAHTPAGGFGFALSLAFGHTGGEGLLYVTGSEAGRFVVAVYGESGALKGTWTGAATPAGSFNNGSPLSVAVDNSSDPLDERKGDVYVVDPQNRAVDVFHPEADGKEHYVEQITGPSPTEPFSFPSKVAVDDVNGDVIVKDANPSGGGSESSVLDIFERGALGEYLLAHQISGDPSGPFNASYTLATDPGNGDIYASNVLLTTGPKGEVLTDEPVVDQFSAAGALIGQFNGAATPGGEFAGIIDSLALDQQSHVYVTIETKPASVYVFSADIVTPDVTTEPPSGVTSASATLAGTVNPDGAGPATCRFAWGPSGHLGKVAECEPPEVADGASPVAVHASLHGLEPDTEYFYRLQATNANGTNPGEASQDRELITSGPGFREASVTDLASTSATLHASVSPHGVPASVYFQYGTSTDYGSDVPAPPGEAIGSGEGTVEVAPRHIQDLQADTVYHYRVVVVTEPNPGEVVAFHGADQTFTTQRAAVAELPDGRQWEMVSPPDKKGATIDPITESGVMRAADDGTAISYLVNLPTEAEPQGFTERVQILSRRGSEGWQSQDISPPHIDSPGPSIGNGSEYRAFSADLSLAAVQPFHDFDPALSAEASEQTAMLRSLDPACGSSCYRPLVTGKLGYANVPPGTVFGAEGDACNTICGPRFIDGTPDLSHVIVEVNNADAEWSDGRLTPIDVLPDGTSPTSLKFIGNVQSDETNPRGTISRDGSRVILEELATLFMRDITLGKTVQLNAAEPVCAAEGRCSSGSAKFQFASADGSKVFFTDSSRLKKDASTAGPDLYECEMVVNAGELECKLSDIASEVVGILGGSEDGSHVYFVAHAVLAQGAIPGEDNLYTWHDGLTKLVAVLSPEDQTDWTPVLAQSPAAVSADGSWLEFMSQRSLTGYDNHDAVSGQPDAEVYLYDADSARLSCASCDPTGARPLGVEYDELEPGSSDGLAGGPRDVWGTHAWVAANVPGWPSYGGGVTDQTRYLFNSGRLFFDSGDALVPQDVNGTEDVYEYEPQGVGSCTSASATFDTATNGCVGLISSGTSAEESAFLEASEGGGDVFFLTFAKLQSQDYDNALDLYDAHECSGASPCLPTPVPHPPSCTTADACRAAPVPQPENFGAPSSATFSGAGNVVPGAGGTVTTKSLTRAQKLANALKACRKKPKRMRAACTKRARSKLGPRKSRKSAPKKKGNR
jgi:hypothetical protein